MESSSSSASSPPNMSSSSSSEEEQHCRAQMQQQRRTAVCNRPVATCYPKSGLRHRAGSGASSSPGVADDDHQPRTSKGRRTDQHQTEVTTSGAAEGSEQPSAHSDGGSEEEQQEEESDAYTLGVPIAYPLPCRFCPGRSFNTHAALAKHLRRDHLPQNKWRLSFRCNGCGVVFEQLRKCNMHAKKNKCNAAPVPEVQQLPQHAAVIRQVRARSARRAPSAQQTAASVPVSTSSEAGAQGRRVQCRRPDASPDAMQTADGSERSQSRSSAASSTAQNEEHQQRTALQTAGAAQFQSQNTTQAAEQQSVARAVHPVALNARLQRVRPERPATAEQLEWSMKFNAVQKADEIDALLPELIVAAKKVQDKAEQRPRRPQQQRRHPQNTAGRRRNAMNADDGPAFDPAAAARIQKIYRQSRVRAYREITEQQSPLCQIPANELENHFRRVFGPSPPIAEQMPEEVPILEPILEGNPLNGLFTANEVWQRLSRCSNTAPGPDTVRYAIWKKFDHSGHILSSVFNALQRTKHIPQSWKRSTTVLLHKKGDRANVGNWRPIALSNTIGKLYSSVMANRLAGWAQRNKRISNAQKGFMPVDGCAEHNFMLQSIIQDVRRKKKQCAIAWLDLTNAFGSIPHDVIFKALHWAGLNEEATETIRRLYEDCLTAIRHAGGLSEEIPIQAGVKQGCPLSPIIFNLALETLLRAVQECGVGYQMEGRKITLLAYADDLVLIANTAEELQQLLNITESVAEWAHLQFNANKCATLHIEGKRKEALQTVFRIQTAILPVLKAEEFYEHLGVPTGYQRAQSADDIVQKMAQHVDYIDQSLLAPWQKFDAINTFVLPCISFHLKNAEVRKKPLTELDKKIVRAAKRWLNLPQRAGIELLYMPHAMGGMALFPLNSLADISQLVHGLRLLSSADIGRTSAQLLNTVVTKRIRRDPLQQETALYLNGSMEGDFANETTDISSVWTRLRVSTRRLRSRLNIAWTNNNNQLQLCLNNSPIEPKAAEYCLRSAIRDHFRRRLLAKPDQGKVAEVTSACDASNHFMANGSFTRFADWRFIHRARLDCLPLNGTRRFGRALDKRCRRCGHPNETLPHVLCHCPPMMATIGRRHNAILQRLTKAFRPEPTTKVRINQTVPGLRNNLRPDLLALNNHQKTALIIDVCMPFENRYVALEAARADKRRKYEAVAQHLRGQGFEVFLDAFVVGPLGGWDPHNDYVLNRMRIGHLYRQLMRKLMVSDAIHWSRDIYVEHVTGAVQYQDWPEDDDGPDGET